MYMCMLMYVYTYNLRVSTLKYNLYFGIIYVNTYNTYIDIYIYTRTHIYTYVSIYIYMFIYFFTYRHV